MLVLNLSLLLAPRLRPRQGACELTLASSGGAMESVLVGWPLHRKKWVPEPRKERKSLHSAKINLCSG